MTNQNTSHDSDTEHVGLLFGRALDGDDGALGRLREYVFAPQAHVETAEFCAARNALRALEGPRLDGARPADALDRADTPWVVAYVDQLVVAARR